MADEIVRTGLSLSELEALAASLGESLRPGDVVLLEGPMGAGKTTWTRALAYGLGVDRPDRVCSPTFNICLVHAGPVPLCHVDLFRLDLGTVGEAAGPSPAFEALGLQAFVDDSADAATSVIVVEWADLWADAVADAVRIQLAATPGSPEHRDLRARPAGGRSSEVLERWRRVAPGGPARTGPAAGDGA